ncbi:MULTISPECIES: hypothetical protein [unclassified Micromonospora]|uniref:hypothetical protein n=1 Tax=Micromonospora TaxID=1873 RepID=UPI001FD7D256|nr:MULTISPECIES: hypothetical protein [unclassified Micromonospora]
MTGSWSTAEDVTQATILVAWRRPRDARLVDGLALPWLLVVATNAGPLLVVVGAPVAGADVRHGTG